MWPTPYANSQLPRCRLIDNDRYDGRYCDRGGVWSVSSWTFGRWLYPMNSLNSRVLNNEWRLTNRVCWIICFWNITHQCSKFQVLCVAPRQFPIKLIAPWLSIIDRNTTYYQRQEVGKIQINQQRHLGSHCHYLPRCNKIQDDSTVAKRPGHEPWPQFWANSKWRTGACPQAKKKQLGVKIKRLLD